MNQHLLPAVAIGFYCLINATYNLNTNKYQKAQDCAQLFTYKKQFKVSAEVEKTFYQIVKQFAGEGIFFIDYFKTLGTEKCGRPSLSYTRFMDGVSQGKVKTDFQSMVHSVDTSVHETAHHFSSEALRHEKNPRSSGLQQAYGLGFTCDIHQLRFPEKPI